MSSPETRAEGGGRSRWLPLLATALLSPLLFLALLEALLAAVGFPAAEPLFVPVPGRPDRLHANPDVMRRFFPGGAPKVAPESIEFAARKPEGTLRIVVQGGSTAAGFPYGRFAGLAGMLGERLESAYPEREIEVISTAMAAVNSFALLDFADEILAIRPDAVLVYAGHNEYMGVLGVGSGLTAKRSLAATRLHLALGRFRVYRYLQALVARARGGLAGPDGAGSEGPAAGRHLMARAAAGSEIGYGSEVYRQGVDQLEANLGDLLERYAEAGVPVYLGTLVSNEKDRPPFASAEGSDGADAWFARGREALSRGDGEAALRAFREARDRDRLPFRAPSALQEVIRAAAAEHAAVLVDVQARFAAASPQGIVGHELLLEHVHPNPEGYFLLADSYLRALRASPLLGTPTSDAPSLEEARREMPITRFDRTLGRYALAELLASVPFVAAPVPVTLPEPADPVERLAWSYHHGRIGWLEAMEALMQLHRRSGRTREAAVVARMAAQAFPGERATQYTTAMLYLELGRLDRARRYLRRSLAIEPDDPAARRALDRIARLEAERAGRAH